MSRNTLKLYVTADGKVALRTFDEIGTASEESADKVEKSGKRQEESFDLVAESAHRTRDAIATLAGTVGFAGLAFGLKDVVEAGQKWQVQQAQLTNALKSTGQYSVQTVSQITDASEKLARSGGYAVPSQLTGLNQFLRLTHSVSASLRDNKAATDLARSGATSLGNAQMLIERAYSGSTRGLQKYLGIIEPVKTAEFALTQAHGFNLAAMDAQSKALGKLGPQWLAHEEVLHNLTPAELEHAQALDKQATAIKTITALQAKFGGSTAAFNHTTSGAISNAENSLDISLEKIGKSFLPAVASIGRAFAGLAETVSDHWSQILGVIRSVTRPVIDTIKSVVGWLERNRQATIAIGSGVAVLVGAYAGWKIATTAMTIAQAALNLAMSADPMVYAVIAIAALAAGLVYAYEKSSTFRSIVQEIGRIGLSVFRSLASAVGETATFIGSAFTHIIRFATSAVRDIGRAFSTVFHVLAWPFQQAWKIIHPILSAIINAVRTIVNLPGHLLHGVSSIASSVGGFISHPFGLHNGGIVHAATGGLLGGYGGGDRIPAYLEAGEGVLRKEAVQSMGSGQFNALNATGSLPPTPAAGLGNEIPIVINLSNYLDGRVIAEKLVKVSARRGALTGNYVSG